jgi:enoyl-CoA hydratase/carnithine racemase
MTNTKDENKKQNNTLKEKEGTKEFLDNQTQEIKNTTTTISNTSNRINENINEYQKFRAFDKEQDALDYEARIDRVMNAIERTRVPTIAAIHGACTGGGASIAACCDLRIGSRAMKYGFPVARTLGNCLSLASYSRLVYLVGPAMVKDIVFQARLVEGEEALAKGLISELHDDQASLMKRAEELARLVASHAPLTLQATKEAVLRLRPTVPHGEGNDLVLMCYMSRDFKEGMTAFLEKRKPVWQGR